MSNTQLKWVRLPPIINPPILSHFWPNEKHVAGAKFEGEK